MREEIINWWKQSEADLKKSKILLNNNAFDGSVFYSQQAVEKALKTLYLLRLKDIPKGHSIVYLAKKLKLPKEMLSGIMDLNPEYLISRYPDMVAGVPAELYDKTIAKRHYLVAINVLKWIKNQLK